jgi:AraC-like DNA-binding protein
MFEDLLPAVERGIMDAAGSIPVVFKGIERSFEKGSKLSKPSRHDYHELTYMRSGRAVFEIEGKTMVLERGATLVIRPHKAHAIQVKDGHADMLVLYFGFSRRSQDNDASPRTLRDVAPETIEQFIDFASGNDDAGGTGNDDEAGKSPYLLIKGKSRQDIASLVERILRENRQEAYAGDLMKQLLAMELLVALARGLREEWEESLRVRNGKARELVRIARDFIIQNHDRDISVAEAAAYVFLSQGYFTRAFRDETGISPMAFLMQVRVDHACKLLEHQDIKVSGVASQVGFSSPQRFNAAFRKYIGMTPMAYRRMAQNNKTEA